MSDISETFFTTVGCMDGRVQVAVANFGKKKFAAEHPDTITEAGIVGQLAKENVDETLLDSIKFKVKEVSIEIHKSNGVIVHGHSACAGNPVDDEKQKDDIRKSVQVLRSFIDSVPVTGVFVCRSDGDSAVWVAEELS